MKYTPFISRWNNPLILITNHLILTSFTGHVKVVVTFWNLVLTPRVFQTSTFRDIHWAKVVGQGWSNRVPPRLEAAVSFFYRLVFFGGKLGCSNFHPTKSYPNFLGMEHGSTEKNRGFGLLLLIFMFHVPLVKNISKNNQVDDGSHHLNTLKTSC